jgi:hypothetical protein
MVDSAAHIDVLSEICSQLSGTDVPWAVVGSASLVLQGVPIEVHDIDILTDKAGAYAIERLLSESICDPVSFSSRGKIRSYVGRLMVRGIKVEIMGDVEIRSQDGSWEALESWQHARIFLTVEGVQIPILPLKYDLDVYRRLGRHDTTEAILELLNKQVS